MSVIFDPQSLRDLAAKIGHEFSDPRLLAEAMTHKSFSNESPEVDAVKYNERLEFLGDAVLSLVISEMLFVACPDQAEGHLSQMRAALVNKQALAQVSAELGLGGQLRLGRGEELTGGRDKDSILSDVFEAVLGSVFLDGGVDAAKLLVTRCLGPSVAEISKQTPRLDPKSRLQEILQARGRMAPSYLLIESAGPDHRKTFVVAAMEDSKEIGRGEGPSKKLAEQAAAVHALDVLEEA